MKPHVSKTNALLVQDVKGNIICVLVGLQLFLKVVLGYVGQATVRRCYIIYTALQRLEHGSSKPQPVAVVAGLVEVRIG